MPNDAHASPRPERTVLVLQGGGALGAYQAGAYEGLAASGLAPLWIAGISIGAINGALIAGNPPERRLARLRAFWDRVSSQVTGSPLLLGEDARNLFNGFSAASAVLFGQPGFYVPRLPPAISYPPGAREALSYYDTAPLAETLAELVDFDLLNGGDVRLSVGAVNIATGNFAYFDSRHERLGVAHIMASAALPPGFPPVEILGQTYWDGGLVSNTPLQFVLDEEPRPDLCIFQVDLFSARGPAPRTLLDVAEREKDIRYSSRTRLNTDEFRRMQAIRSAVARLLDRLPAQLDDDPDVAFLRGQRCDAAVTIMHLIHRRKSYFSQSKDFEFSRTSVREHWQAGRDDVAHSLRHPDWRNRQRPRSGVQVFDLTSR